MIRRALSVLLALVLSLQGGLALARPDCRHAAQADAASGDDAIAPVGGASAPRLLAESGDDPHAAHRAANTAHDHGAMDSANTDPGDDCADDCRCQGHCATSASSAISAAPAPGLAAYLADAPERTRPAPHVGVAPARRLRPPIEA